MRIIVTGNIGCGKSTVCQALQERLPGYEMASIDDLVRTLYTDPDFQQELITRFGTTDRKQVAQIVFADPDARHRLERLTDALLAQQVTELFARPNIIIEFPLFFEMGYLRGKDMVVLAVVCDESLQQTRVMARDGLDAAAYQARASSTLTQKTKAAFSDLALDTGLPPEELSAALDALPAACRRQVLRRRCNNFFMTPAIWPLIEQAYTESHRAYHTLDHLYELFERLSAHRQERWWPAVELAIWGHDFIYSTAPGIYRNNESASADVFDALIWERCPTAWRWSYGGLSDVAQELIRATTDHALSDTIIPQFRRAAALFLDADLAILADSPEKVDAYDRAIAFEWGQNPAAPDEGYRAERLEVLARLAARPTLFLSEEFAGLTAAAQNNLARLISRYQLQGSLS